jgi:hypothetical protein
MRKGAKFIHLKIARSGIIRKKYNNYQKRFTLKGWLIKKRFYHLAGDKKRRTYVLLLYTPSVYKTFALQRVANKP